MGRDLRFFYLAFSKARNLILDPLMCSLNEAVRI